MLVAVGGNEEYTSALAAREDDSDYSGYVSASDMGRRRRRDVISTTTVAKALKVSARRGD